MPSVGSPPPRARVLDGPFAESVPAGDQDDRSAPVCGPDPLQPIEDFMYSDSHTPPSEKVGE